MSFKFLCCGSRTRTCDLPAYGTGALPTAPSRHIEGLPVPSLTNLTNNLCILPLCWMSGSRRPYLYGLIIDF